MDSLFRYINWSTPLLILSIYGLMRYFVKSDIKSKKKIHWTAWESVGVTLAVYFFSQFIAALVLYAVPSIFGVSAKSISNYFDSNVIGQFILILAVQSLTVFFLLKFLERRQATLKTIGLKKPMWLDLRYVLIGFGIYFILYLALINITKAVIPNLDLNQAQDIGFKNTTNLQLPLVFISIVVLQPLIEEILMRGFLYAGLKNKLHVIWAVLITSSLFAVAHLQAGNGKPLLWTAAIDTFVLSLVLIYLKEKTGSLTASIGLHMLKNCLAFLSLFVFHVV